MIGSLDILQEIWKGLFIGVGAGVTTAAILGLWRWFIRFLDRREQITYIRDLIASQMERITSAIDVPPSQPGGEPIPADRVRFVYFREFQTVLPVVLTWRATALTYKEVSSLQRTLADVERTMTDLPLQKHGIFPLSIAQSLFERLQSLSWLGLPKKDVSQP